MKQKDLISAYKTISSLKEQKLPLKISYALHKIKNQIQDQYDFQTERENAILKEFSPERTENGQLKFSKPEQAQEFMNELIELGNIEVDISSWPKWDISLNSDIELSGEDLDALEPFVNFIE